MSHIALQEALDGKVVTWMEKVTDEEYLAGAPERSAADDSLRLAWMERATQARRRSSVEESATAGRRVSLWLNPFDVTDFTP